MQGPMVRRQTKELQGLLVQSPSMSWKQAKAGLEKNRRQTGSRTRAANSKRQLVKILFLESQSIHTNELDSQIAMTY